MLTLKQKLHSQRGASMLMAMIFLLFCLLIGGSVLAAATANSSRIEHLVNDQQDFLNQRSALTIMADMLTPQADNTLQISFKPNGSRVSVKIPSTNFKSDDIPSIQQLLYDIVIDHYYDSDDTLQYSLSGWTTTFGRPASGTIQINLGAETLNAVYSVAFTADNCVLEIKFVKASEDAENLASHARLVMTGSIVTSGNNITIGWGIPSIQK